MDKISKISKICSDHSRHAWKRLNFARMAHQATKNFKSVQTCQSGLPKWQFCLDWPQKIVILLSDGSIPPISIACHAPTILASCYNSFDCPQNILKFFAQVIEDLQLCIIKVFGHPD